MTYRERVVADLKAEGVRKAAARASVREMVLKRARENPELTSSEIGQACGTSRSTVDDVRKVNGLARRKVNTTPVRWY